MHVLLLDKPSEQLPWHSAARKTNIPGAARIPGMSAKVPGEKKGS